MIPRHWTQLVLAMALGCFTLVAVFAHHFPHFGCDVIVARHIQSITIPGFETSMIGISWLGTGWTPWALAVATSLALLLSGWRLEAVIYMSGFGLGAALNRLLKIIIARPRPSDSLIQVLIEYPNQSFPSGHVVFFVQFFGFLFFPRSPAAEAWSLAQRVTDITGASGRCRCPLAQRCCRRVSGWHGLFF